MWAILRAPPSSFIKPLLLLHYSPLLRSHSLILLTSSRKKLRYFHFFRRSMATVTAMDSTAGGTDHVAGDWYSVPELRLRDHRFIVPLDYSRDRASSPKISVFAREVVAGSISIHQLINYSSSKLIIWLLTIEQFHSNCICISVFVYTSFSSVGICFFVCG